MSNLLWEELNATNQLKYDEKRASLKKQIDKATEEFKNVNTIHDIYKFLKSFSDNCEFSRPIDIEDDGNGQFVDSLCKYNYPNEFIEWHRHYGNLYFWIESTRITSTQTVLENIEDPYYLLLTKNNFLNVTNDGGGNCYVYDMNMKTPELKFADHDKVWSNIELLDDIFSEYFDFWYDDEEKKYINKQNLDIAKILCENRKFSETSEYLKSYFAKELESTGIYSFSDFLKVKIKEGFENILIRYDIN